MRFTVSNSSNNTCASSLNTCYIKNKVHVTQLRIPLKACGLTLASLHGSLSKNIKLPYFDLRSGASTPAGLSRVKGLESHKSYAFMLVQGKSSKLGSRCCGYGRQTYSNSAPMGPRSPSCRSNCRHV